MMLYSGRSQDGSHLLVRFTPSIFLVENFLELSGTLRLQPCLSFSFSPRKVLGTCNKNFQ